MIVGTYRNDELGRGHPLRRLRNDLRRARLLREIAGEPLDQADTTALATRILGRSPGPAPAPTLYERTEDVPLFVMELADALVLRWPPGALRRHGFGATPGRSGPSS